MAEKDIDRNALVVKGKEIQSSIAFQDGLCHYGVKLYQSTKNTEKSNPFVELEVARSMCPELDTLFVTLNGQVLDQMEDLQAALLHQVRLSNFDLQN